MHNAYTDVCECVCVCVCRTLLAEFEYFKPFSSFSFVLKNYALS